MQADVKRFTRGDALIAIQRNAELIWIDLAGVRSCGQAEY